MKKGSNTRNQAYIRIYEEEHRLTAIGPEFSEFYAAIPHKPPNLLILDGCPMWNAFERHDGLNLDIIPGAQMQHFVDTEDIYNYGNFCWVDYAQEESLDRVTEEELAELLYFRYRCKPLHDYHVGSLGNRYAYYTHDDGYFASIYMDRPADYCAVIERLIRTHTQGRLRSMAPLPPEILDRLYGMAQKGLLLDLERAFTGGPYPGIHAYCLASADIYSADDLHERLDRLRGRRSATEESLGIWYNVRRKRWETS